MKYLVLILLLVSNTAWAETPEERAKLYFTDIESGNFVAAAKHFDPSQLKEFRSTMEFYKEIPVRDQTEFIQTFFGADQTTESLDKISDVDFFAKLFTFMMRQADAVGGLNFDGLEILGGVKEGSDISHLVTRNRVTVGKLNVEAMEVVSLMKSGDEWRILMSGQIKGFADQLRATFALPSG